MLVIYGLCFYFSQSTDLYLSWEEPLAVGFFFPKVHLYFCFHFSDFFEIQSTLHTVHRNLCDAFYQLEDEITDSVADGS